MNETMIHCAHRSEGEDEKFMQYFGEGSNLKSVYFQGGGDDRITAKWVLQK